MLLCDICDAGWHMDCLPVPLERVPEGMHMTLFMSVPVCHSWKSRAIHLTSVKAYNAQVNSLKKLHRRVEVSKV